MPVLTSTLCLWWLQCGNIGDDEMFRTFNMGVGMVLVIDRERVDAVLRLGLDAFVLGRIVEGDGVLFG